MLNLIRRIFKKKRIIYATSKTTNAVHTSPVNSDTFIIKEQPDSIINSNNSNTNSSSSSSNISITSNKDDTTRVFNKTQTLHNLISKSNETNQSTANIEAPTLEMMYQDNSIYASQQPLNNNSQHSMLTNTTIYQLTDQPNYFINSVSILKLDQEIHFKLAQLKQVSYELHLNAPVHISMLESLYEMKLSSLRRDGYLELKQFDRDTDLVNDKESGSAKRGRNLSKLIQATGKLIKSGIRRHHSRSKSVDASEKDTVARVSARIQKREAIEKTYESKIRDMQFEIIKSIGDIEIQMAFLKRRHQEAVRKHHHQMNAECCSGCSKHHHHHHHHRSRHHQQRHAKQRNNSCGDIAVEMEPLRSKHKQAAKYASNETMNNTALQKRIRNKMIQSKRSTSVNSESDLNASRASVNRSFNASQYDFSRYKNPYAHETDV
jgi:hypothetical protein